MTKLTNKQQLFCKEYLIDLNATQAAIRAGYSAKTAASIGEENLKKPDIKAFLEKAMAERSKRTEITADMVLQEFAKIAFFDIRKLFDASGKLKKVADLDDDTAAAIAGIDHMGLGDGITVKIKLSDKKGALDSIGKHLGMFIDKHEHSGKNGEPLPPLQVILSNAVKPSSKTK